MTWELFLIAFFASIDRQAGLHIMLSRPFVISILVGLVTSNLQLTFYVGIMLEIFGLIDVQVGTRIPREDTFVAYVMSVLVGLGHIVSVAKFLLILIVVLLLMYAANYTEELVRKINRYLLLKKGANVGSIFSGVALSGLKGIIVYPLGVYLCVFILDYLKGMFGYGFNIKVYIVFLSILLSGYLLRFLSFRSVYKYVVFVVGLVLGWVIG
ncbi:MAG: PTS sugar transporter subunit IIC [Calditerrivibrio sp.]|nr:PTS sugar transporter subunit IIC [Calditerrivibrio sp.]